MEISPVPMEVTSAPTKLDRTNMVPPVLSPAKKR